jgi:hypothetical protein
MYEFTVPEKYRLTNCLSLSSKVSCWSAAQYLSPEIKDWLRANCIRHDVVGKEEISSSWTTKPIRIFIYNEEQAIMFRMAFGFPCSKLDTRYV